MDLQALSQIIGSVGFPIVACCVMFYQNNKMQETLAELSNTLSLISERLSDVEKTVKGGE